MLTIKTNNNWRDFLYRYEVPDRILQDQFDYLDEDQIDGFIKYKGFYYHLNEFMCIDHNAPSSIKGWDGIHNDSMSTGVLIKLSDDGEQYKIATFAS